MGCNADYDICITRGTTFALDVGLSASWAEVADNPTGYRGTMVFREAQDDDLSAYLTLIATPEVNPDPLPDEVPVYMRFVASAGQTQSPPEWDHVHYVELSEISGADPTVVRLFQGRATIED
jgi:hypothetical protein